MTMMKVPGRQWMNHSGKCWHCGKDFPEPPEEKRVGIFRCSCPEHPNDSAWINYSDVWADIDTGNEPPLPTERHRTLGNTRLVCYQCERPFSMRGAQQRADVHAAEHPGFRRATAGCPKHNHSDTICFNGDCEFK